MTFNGNYATTARHKGTKASARLGAALLLLGRELQLFASVQVARFIVWRELRRRQRADGAAAR